MLKNFFLFFVVVAWNAGSSQSLEVFRMAEFSKLYENLLLRNKDGAILVSGLSSAGEVLFEELDRSGNPVWVKNLLPGYELLDVCTGQNDSNYLALVRHKNPSLSGNIFLLDINRLHPGIVSSYVISYDTLFSFHLGAILDFPGRKTKILVADTSKNSMVAFDLDHSDTFVLTNEFVIPYVGVKLSALDVFLLEKDRVILTDHRAKIRIEMVPDNPVLSFERTDYGFLGLNMKHPSADGITGFTDERQGRYVGWTPVRREGSTAFYKHHRDYALNCEDGAAISGCLDNDSMISYAYVVNDSNPNGSGKLVRLHFFSYDMQKSEFMDLKPAIQGNLRTVFHQVLPDRKILVFMIFDKDSADEMYLFKADSTGLLSQEQSCVEWVSSPSGYFPPIFPWANRHALSVGTIKPAYSKMMVTNILGNRNPGWIKYCGIIPALSFSVYIPNSFSPNGDLLNDEFYPIGDEIVNYEIEIYSSQGKKISGSINTPWSGIDAPDSKNSSYLYQVKVLLSNGEKKEYKGIVTVVK